MCVCAILHLKRPIQIEGVIADAIDLLFTLLAHSTNVLCNHSDEFHCHCSRWNVFIPFLYSGHSRRRCIRLALFSTKNCTWNKGSRYSLSQTIYFFVVRISFLVWLCIWKRKMKRKEKKEKKNVCWYFSDLYEIIYYILCYSGKRFQQTIYCDFSFHSYYACAIYTCYQSIPFYAGLRTRCLCNAMKNA